jgi:hypothetical protein
MTGHGDLEDEMDRLHSDVADRLLAGNLDPEDAPRGYGEVAALLQAASVPSRDDLPGEAAAVAAVVEAIRTSTLAPMPASSKRKSVITKAKIAAAGLAGALSLTTGLAAANALPGAAQSVASDALAKVGVSVPSPNDHAGDHPNVRGKSADHNTSADAHKSGDNKGSEISNLARTTDATGVDKGAAISGAASDGKSQAGQHGGATDANPPAGPPTSTPASDKAPVATPNPGGTGTADTAGHGQSSTGATNADQHSGGASSDGSGNDASHRP